MQMQAQHGGRQARQTEQREKRKTKPVGSSRLVHNEKDNPERHGNKDQSRNFQTSS
jgi:hypothetical protein